MVLTDSDDRETNSGNSDRETNSGNSDTENTATYQNREEYIEKLKQWLDEARLWHNICAGFPYYMQSQNQVNSNIPNNAFTPGFVNNDNNRQQQQPQQQQQQNVPVFQQGVYEFVIPPLWKRAVAEVVDFLILLFIKMILTFILIETFYIINIENYRFDSFRQNFQDPKLAMQMSAELLTLEILHRFLVCCYEVYWLRGGPCATPGKRYMGLIVIKVDEIIPVPDRADDIIRATNCEQLGLRRAIIRAVIKNLFLGIMLPMFTFYIFRYNRTGYDAISNSIVVEYNPNNQFQPIQ